MLRWQFCEAGRKCQIVAIWVNFSERIREKLITLFLHKNVQTEAVSIQFEHFHANRRHFYSDFGHRLDHFA
jgi:hypothetical protein